MGDFDDKFDGNPRKKKVTMRQTRKIYRTKYGGGLLDPINQKNGVIYSINANIGTHYKARHGAHKQNTGAARNEALVVNHTNLWSGTLFFR